MRIWRAAAIPFSLGRPMSNRTSCGCSACACRTASNHRHDGDDAQVAIVPKLSRINCRQGATIYDENADYWWIVDSFSVSTVQHSTPRLVVQKRCNRNSIPLNRLRLVAFEQPHFAESNCAAVLIALQLRGLRIRKLSPSWVSSVYEITGRFPSLLGRYSR